MREFIVVLGAICTGFFASLAVAQSPGDSLSQARQLLEQRNPKGAYALLKPMEEARAGDPEFDYVLGVAALDAGRPTEAIFALERVLAVNPGHAQARAEIGRAYFQIGETRAARRELEAVRRQGVPANAAANIDRFLSEIDRVEAGPRTRVTAYLEATLGHDTNVNSGVTNSQVALPAFGGAVVQLNAAGVKEKDEFLGFGAGVGVRHPLTGSLSLVAALNANLRANFSADQFDTNYIDGHIGVTQVAGEHAFTFAAQGN
jgi:tetratricopeptide (TPR) repeat protein